MNIRIYVGNDINNKNIILNGEVIDLSPDENIEMTLKQTDTKDISSNWNDFSKVFPVPATNRNNRLFKYWYDVNNSDQWSSIDGIPCRIDVNGIFFKKGTLKINDCTFDSNGYIKNYNISFSANLKSLKDQFGDIKIGELNYSTALPSSAIDLTDTYVLNKIISSTGTPDYLEFPLISTNRLLDDFEALKYINFSTANGLRKEELRPALVLRKIFKAIEKTFDIRFVGNFYENDAELDKLYIWLNKNEEPSKSSATIIEFDGVPVIDDEYIVDVVTFNTAQNYFSLNRNSFEIINFSARIVLSTSNTTVPYKVFIQQVILFDDGTVDEVKTEKQTNGGFVSSTSDYVTGSFTIGYDIEIVNIPVNQGNHYRIIVESKGQITFSSTRFIIFARYFSFSTTRTRYDLTSTIQNTLSASFNIAENLPDMTVQDFTDSIQKMFNLVIIPVTNNLLLSSLNTENAYQLEYYNDYFGKQGIQDITKHIVRGGKMSKMKNYKKFEFKHADSTNGTNIIFKKSQTPIREYGSLKAEFKTGDEGEYKVESKFNLAIWRVLPNVYPNSEIHDLKTTYIIADSLDEKFEKGVYNKPIIFYYNQRAETPSDKKLAFSYTDDNSTYPISSYPIFSNVDNLDFGNYKNSLSFSTEFEFGSQLRTKSLYYNNYQKQMNAVFSRYSREWEYIAYLPKHIYTNLPLGSQLIIRDQRFTINELTINLINGETKLKLNNIVEEYDVRESA